MRFCFSHNPWLSRPSRCRTWFRVLIMSHCNFSMLSPHPAPIRNSAGLCGCLGFPGGPSGKELACQCRRHKRRWFDAWVYLINFRIQPQIPWESQLISYTKLHSLGSLTHYWNETTLFFFSAFSSIFQFLLPNTQHDRSMILGIFCIFSLLSRQYCKSTPILPPILLLWLHLKHEGLLPLPVIWFNISVLMILIYCL